MGILGASRQNKIATTVAGALIAPIAIGLWTFGTKLNDLIKKPEVVTLQWKEQVDRQLAELRAATEQAKDDHRRYDEHVQWALRRDEARAQEMREQERALNQLLGSLRGMRTAPP